MCDDSRTVQDYYPLPVATDQAGLAQLLQMLGGIGRRQSGHLRQFLHAARALGDISQQFQPVTVAQWRRSSGAHRDQDLHKLTIALMQSGQSLLYPCQQLLV